MAVVLYTTRDDGYARVVVDEANEAAKAELYAEQQARNIIGVGDHRFTGQFMREALFNETRGNKSPLDLVTEHDDERPFASHAMDFVLAEQRGLNGSNPERATHLKALLRVTRGHITMPDITTFANIAETVRQYRPAEGAPRGKERR